MGLLYPPLEPGLSDGARIFRSVHDGNRRGGARGQQDVSGDAPGAAVEERRLVADEHAQRKTRILSCGVDGRGRAVSADVDVDASNLL